MGKILKEIVINELSAVDVPAQVEATVVLIKRYIDEGETNVGEETKDTTTENKTDETAKAETGPTKEQFAGLLAKFDRVKEIVSLSPAERGGFDQLDDMVKQDEFLAMKPAQRVEKLQEMTKSAQEKDPVVYTTVDGVSMRKSAGETMIALAKSNDGLRKRLDASEAVVLQKNFEERVSREIPNLPGTISDRAAILKAVDSMPDQHRVGAMNVLKAQNSAMAKAFDTQGVTTRTGDNDSSPVVKLEAMTKTLVSKNPGLSNEAAFSQVLTTPEGQRLYTASL